jgi:hypothetical protein
METKMKVDTKDLEQKLTSLKKSLAFVTDNPDPNAVTLWNLIHRQGWTTPVQVALAGQILDAMNQQASALGGMSTALQNHVEASIS